MPKKLKKKSRKSKKSSKSCKYKMRKNIRLIPREENIRYATVNTGASDTNEYDIQTIMNEYDVDERPTSNSYNTGESMMNERPTFIDMRNLREMRQMQNRGRDMQRLENSLNQMSIKDYENQFGPEFLDNRRSDIRYREEQMSRDRSEMIFDMIARNDIYGIQSLLQSDIYISTNLRTEYINSNDNGEVNTFLTYAVRRDRVEIVKMLLLSGAPIPIGLENLTDNTRMIRIIRIFRDPNMSMEEKHMRSRSPIII